MPRGLGTEGEGVSGDVCVKEMLFEVYWIETVGKNNEEHLAVFSPRVLSHATCLLLLNSGVFASYFGFLS